MRRRCLEPRSRTRSFLPGKQPTFRETLGPCTEPSPALSERWKNLCRASSECESINAQVPSRYEASGVVFLHLPDQVVFRQFLQHLMVKHQQFWTCAACNVAEFLRRGMEGSEILFPVRRLQFFTAGIVYLVQEDVAAVAGAHYSVSRS